MSDYELFQGDCLEIMPTLAKGSVAMVFADLPYGCTDNKWDSAIDLVHLRACWANALAGACCIVMTANQPFCTKIIAAFSDVFRYDLIFEKANASGFLHAKRQPMRAHEHVVVCYSKQPTYNPQKTVANKPWSGGRQGTRSANWLGLRRDAAQGGLERHPRSVLRPKCEAHSTRMHPTQKPLALLEWLVATYTNPGDTVLDPCMGSGTTGHACANLGRKFIGIEKDPTYFAAAKARIETAYAEAAKGAPQRELAV